MKLNGLMCIINVRTLNRSDHELEAHKSAEKQIYIGWDLLDVFHKFLKIYEDLRYEIKCLEVCQY